MNSRVIPFDYYKFFTVSLERKCYATPIIFLINNGIICYVCVLNFIGNYRIIMYGMLLLLFVNPTIKVR